MATESSHQTPVGHGRDKNDPVKCEAPGFLSKVTHAGRIYGIKSFVTPMLWLRDWKEYFAPPDGAPNIIKTYECRPALPVRIFFPSGFDQTSPTLLPTVFTIHGGGFCIGHIRDDDEWNRAFADEQNVLVIALNYSKAPGAPFPTAVHDLEALLLAALADESLPIDRSSRTNRPDGLSRTALLGFSAGGNLALSVSQLPSIRSHPHAPAAAVSIYGALDLSIPPEDKIANRPHKTSLPPPRNTDSDPLIPLAPTFDWSYIPYGHNLRDPLLSPHFAPRENLPPYVCLIAAELDMLAHESWRLASRLAHEGIEAHGGPDAAGTGRQVPDRKSKDPKWRVCGQKQVETAALRGLGDGEDADERFAFEDTWEGGGVKWLLVPDVLHGFDNLGLRALMGGEEAMADAEIKTKAYMPEVGRWLKKTVWRV
ncbi:Alpha/Beta hydrolase protein [Podospora didyma]|uniref:Alpha/Beta hydrolase protein n=1 Tax=Podospora didyma TaxID=330526 RepID=A0AAE0NQZ1_9PEZI|nr:Alpha/Beta hydrolase protein [Podospora didyma]